MSSSKTKEFYINLFAYLLICLFAKGKKAEFQRYRKSGF